MKLTKKRVIVLFSIFILLFQIFFPSIYSHASLEDVENEILEKTDIKEIQNEVLDDKEVDNKENIRNTESIKEQKDIEVFNNEENSELEVLETKENEIMVMAGDYYVGNETEFRNALANQASVIHLRQSIVFSAPIYINYGVEIIPESNDNALGYRNSGSFIVVQNHGSLTLNGIVVHTNSAGVNGALGIEIQNGGYVTFKSSSIVDAGLGNTGILICNDATLLLYSSEFVNCGYGINLQGTGNLIFATQEGRCNNFYNNNTAIFIDNFTTTCNMNQNICMHDNKDYGVYIGNSIGNVNISAGTYYNNTYCIHARSSVGGNVNISGGDYYANGWALWCGSNFNLTGGTIHNNYYGVLTDGAYQGSFNMTGGNIYNNTSYDIFHSKTIDGGCTITGGTVAGQIYLVEDGSYINTNASYPTLKITPANYFFKRKLVKTNSNAIANSEISRITLTPKDDWYMNVDGQYIVLWNEKYETKYGNVIIRCKDTNGKVIKEETKNGVVGENYSVTAPTIAGYNLTKTPNNTKGKYTESDIIVEFQYELKKQYGKVIIRCKDKNGNIIKEETKEGEIGKSYSITAPTIPNYELINMPDNSSGTYEKNDIIIEFQYDLVNVAKVTFEDILSGVVSAKYWYNASGENFTGNGTDFSNGTVFEDYGYYKVVVENGVGLQKKIIFALNKDSVTR